MISPHFLVGEGSRSQSGPDMHRRGGIIHGTRGHLRVQGCPCQPILAASPPPAPAPSVWPEALRHEQAQGKPGCY